MLALRVVDVAVVVSQDRNAARTEENKHRAVSLLQL